MPAMPIAVLNDSEGVNVGVGYATPEQATNPAQYANDTSTVTGAASGGSSSQSTGGYWVETATGPLYLADGLPDWVIQLSIADAGGLVEPTVGAPGPAIQQQVPVPPGGRSVPGPTGPSYSTPGTPSAGVTGTFTTPPGGLPLNAPWAGIAKTFATALNPRIDPAAVDDALMRGRAYGDKLGFGEQGEWSGIMDFFHQMLHPDAYVVGPGSPAGIASNGDPNVMFVDGAGVPLAGLAAGAGAFPDLMNLLHQLDPSSRLEGLQELYEKVFGEVHGALIGALSVGDGEDLESIDDRAARALEIALGAGFTAHTIAVGLEMLQPLKSMGFGQLAALAAEAAGFAPVTDALWFSMLKPSIRRPMEHLYNTKFPTERFNAGEVLQLARRHEYDSSAPVGPLRTPSAFIDAMSVHGYSEERAATMWAHSANTGRLYDTIRLADVLLETGPPPPDAEPLLLHAGTSPTDPLWFLDYQLREAGYPTWLIPMYKLAIAHRATATDRNAQRAENLNELVAGYIDSNTYAGRERGLGERDESIALGTVTALQRRNALYWKDLETQWTTAFLNNQIDLEELHNNLAVFIIDPGELQAKLTVAQLKLEVKTKTKATTAENTAVSAAQRAMVNAYRDQYTNGLITETALETSVQALGFTPAYASAIAYAAKSKQDVAAAKKTNAALDSAEARATELLAQSYEVQFADGLLLPDELLTSFLSAGMAIPVAKARVARDWARVVSAATKVAKQEQERENRATDQVEKQQANAAARAADQYVTKLQNLYLEHYKLLHANHEITSDQLYQALVEAGWPLPLAAELTQVEADHLKEGPWAPSPLSAPGPIVPLF